MPVGAPGWHWRRDSASALVLVQLMGKTHSLLQKPFSRKKSVQLLGSAKGRVRPRRPAPLCCRK